MLERIAETSEKMAVKAAVRNAMAIKWRRRESVVELKPAMRARSDQPQAIEMEMSATQLPQK